ncbi:histidine phosphatase family protein [Dactylosporangium sp. NPDC051485]|uniref:histidine phosphatase family protein n=1 Tax=Dactylosporangium sp. NPDC051485 TaxID=3154846 RepID=UPI00343B15D5
MTHPRSELLLIRHGHAHCNDTGTIAGPACTGLTDTGTAQAAATAAWLASTGPVRAVHASTTRRAADTAKVIAARLGLAVIAEPGLRVPDPGAAEGVPWPQARGIWPADPHNATRPAAPGGEAWCAYLDRATVALGRILELHPGGRIVVVGHTETLTAMLHHLLGVAGLGRLKLAFDHAACSLWQATSEWPGIAPPWQRWTLVRHNQPCTPAPAAITAT